MKEREGINVVLKKGVKKRVEWFKLLEEIKKRGITVGVKGVIVLNEDEEWNPRG